MYILDIIIHSNLSNRNFQDADIEENSEDSSCEDDRVVEVDVKLEAEEGNVKNPRERWSMVWNYFDTLPIGSDGRERAKCKKCGRRYICETKNGTGSLRKHIKN